MAVRTRKRAGNLDMNVVAALKSLWFPLAGFLNVIRKAHRQSIKRTIECDLCHLAHRMDNGVIGAVVRAAI